MLLFTPKVVIASAIYRVDVKAIPKLEDLQKQR